MPLGLWMAQLPPIWSERSKAVAVRPASVRALSAVMPEEPAPITVTVRTGVVGVLAVRGVVLIGVSQAEVTHW